MRVSIQDKIRKDFIFQTDAFDYMHKLQKRKNEGEPIEFSYEPGYDRYRVTFWKKPNVDLRMAA
jgi:hypothetical protein